MDYFDKTIKFDPVNHYIVFTPEEMRNIKMSMTQTDIKILEAKLNYLFDMPLESVVTKKASIPFDIDPNDYVSLATYYWPNPDTPDGLPYILKDGYSNPEGEAYDKDKLRRLAFLVYYSVLLYYLSEDETYYELMKKHCLNFFVNDKTRMNPNMKHAQMQKGINKGRGLGIIDYSANFTYALTMLTNLRELKLLKNDLFHPLKRWHKEFYTWLSYSNIALEESRAENNHGTMYDFAIVVIKDFISTRRISKKVVTNFINNRLAKQMNEKGELPLELKRTKSLSYSLMGLKGMYDFASIVAKDGYNLWDLSWYKKDVSGSLTKGVSFLCHYLVDHVEPWPYEQVTMFDEATILPLVFVAKKMNIINEDSLVKIRSENLSDDLLFSILFKKNFEFDNKERIQ